jgi:putative FmdB family regulatory protein
MPIYEFECTACGHRFDELMRLSDPEPAVCPSCGAPQVRKRLSAPQFRLAGGGWYETDFKKDGDSKRNLAGDAGDAKPAEAKTSETKAADSKPADSKPAESKPADSKSADGKSGEGKSGSSKAAETPSTPKPAASTPPPSSST